jgi:hypothetical protein
MLAVISLTAWLLVRGVDTQVLRGLHGTERSARRDG